VYTCMQVEKLYLLKDIIARMGREDKGEWWRG
jgi:hypothetical protein